jgi:hypothetical protein
MGWAESKPATPPAPMGSAESKPASADELSAKRKRVDSDIDDECLDYRRHSREDPCAAVQRPRHPD